MTSRIPVVALALALASAMSAGPATAAKARSQEPTEEELRALVERLVAHQHGNDAALAEFERRERRMERKDNEAQRITDDRTFRVVPTGTGTLRLILAEKGQAVSPEFYRKKLRELEKVLLDALNPQLPRQKEAIAKWEKRTRERREMVDAVPKAFRVTWLGREARNGRRLAKLQFDPNPAFKGRTRNIEIFSHVRAILWVDEQEAQVARVEAEIVKDISVFGGVFGKVYKGGRFVMEQAKVADEVWLPTRYEFVFDGRRFVFPFSVNEVIEASAYHRIGPPKEALAAVRREINGARPGAAPSAQ